MMDADESSRQSGTLLDAVNSLLRSIGLGELTDHFIRKTAHFVEYFVLGGTLSGAVYSYTFSVKRMLPIALPIGLAVAVCDELIQTTSPGRSCEIADMALDFSAVVTAAVIMSVIFAVYRRHMVKKEG